MTDRVYSGIRRMTDVIIKDLASSPQRFLVVPNCIFNNYNQGISIEEVFASSPLGVDTLVAINPTQQNPTIGLTFPKKTPETFGMKLGYRFEQAATMNVKIARNAFLVEAGGYDGAELGFEGYGIVEDTLSYASYLNEDGLSIPLNQENYTTMPAASTDTLSFAVGANGALKFSADLIGKYISYSIDATWTSKGSQLTETPFDRFELAFVMVQDDLSIVRLEFAEAVIDPSDGDINFEESSLPVTFRPVLNGAGCVPIRVKYLDQRRKCLNAAA